MKQTLNIVGGVFCGIACLVLFFIQIAYLFVVPARNLITTDTIKEIIGNTNVKEIISENPSNVSDVYGLFDSLGFSVEETNEILESESFKDFMNEKIFGNINNILDSKKMEIDYDDIEGLISNIEKESGITFENKEDILKLVKESYPDVKEGIDFTNTINENMNPKLLGIVKVLASGIIMIAFIISFIFIYLSMCLFRWSFYKPLIWYGITTIVSSFLTLQAFLGLSFVEVFKDERIEKFKPILTPALKTFKNKGMIISGVMLSIGIIMVVLFYFINKKVKENDPDNIDTKLNTL